MDSYLSRYSPPLSTSLSRLPESMSAKDWMAAREK